MDHYSFLATDTLGSDFLDDLEARMESQETVVLESFEELKTLVELFGSNLSNKIDLTIKEVSAVWQLSNNLYEFTDDNFEKLYRQWLVLTRRENSMDEYGQMLYFRTFIKQLNKAKYKLIIKEEI